jgi:hypothetical protein
MGLFGKRASDLKFFGLEAFLNQLKIFKSPRRMLGAALCAAGIALLAISLSGALGNAPPPDQSQPQATAANTPEGTVAQSDVAEQQQPARQTEQPTQQTPQPSPPKTQTNTAQTQGANTQTTNAEKPPEPEPATIEVSLTINNSFKGTVNLPEGSNHCDVLRQAQTDGLISNLSLKYNKALKTYGVYVIDGVGDENNVWWTYTVNGKSPPLGCSLVTAQDGDTVKWTYIK